MVVASFAAVDCGPLTSLRTVKEYILMVCVHRGVLCLEGIVVEFYSQVVIIEEGIYYLGELFL